MKIAETLLNIVLTFFEKNIKGDGFCQGGFNPLTIFFGYISKMPLQHTL